MLLDIAKYEKVYIIDQNYSSTLKYVLFCKMSHVNIYPKSEVLIPVTFYLRFPSYTRFIMAGSCFSS